MERQSKLSERLAALAAEGAALADQLETAGRAAIRATLTQGEGKPPISRMIVPVLPEALAGWELRLARMVRSLEQVAAAVQPVAPRVAVPSLEQQMAAVGKAAPKPERVEVPAASDAPPEVTAGEAPQ